MLIITVFGRQRQAGPWVSYLSLFREFQAGERSCLKTQDGCYLSVFPSLAVVNTSSKRNLGKERIYLIYRFQSNLREAKAGTWKQEPEKGL